MATIDIYLSYFSNTQRRKLQAEYKQMQGKLREFRNFFAIDVATVDSSIGREVDFAIFSRVASGSASKNAFLSCPKRLCVALTRASFLLVVIGSCESTSTEYPGTAWDEFVNYCGQKKVKWPVASFEDDLDRILYLSRRS